MMYSSLTKLKYLDTQRREMLKTSASLLIMVFSVLSVPNIKTAVAESSDVQKILVLNSYHPTYPWTQTSLEGIKSVLDPYEDRFRLDIEYMNTKYFHDEMHYENLLALYRHQTESNDYDVIITVDNNALLFLLRYRSQLYPNVPVVFCGVDNFHGSLMEVSPSLISIDSLLRGHNNMTGVIESLDHESTIEIALKLHPSAKQVIIVQDGMIADRYWPIVSEQDLTKFTQRFGGHVRFERLLLTEPSFDKLLEKVEAAQGQTIVYLPGTFRRLAAELYFSQSELEKLRRRCTAPIYILMERWFGYDIVVGGKINSGFHQGQAAAGMALRILNGESAQNIPILRKEPTMYMFDYNQLRRFGIPLSKLPEASIVLNEPKSFYYLYKGRIWTVTAVILALTVMVIILSANILRRKRAEVKLLHYQKQLKSLASELSLTEERERRRIAVELHDRIGQSLVITKIKLQTLLKRQSFGQSCRELSEVCDSLDRTIQDTKSLTFDLSYPILYELGFEAAVAEWLAEQIEAEHGIATEFEDDGRPKPLEEDIRVLLFRSVQEVLINVVKHADARKVRVFSRKVDNRIHVGVEDDGVGFNLSEVSSIAAETGGFGLFSIRERLEQVGGRLEVDSEPGRGTKVMIVAPLKQ